MGKIWQLVLSMVTSGLSQGFLSMPSNRALTLTISIIKVPITITKSKWRFYPWRSRNIWFLPHIGALILNLIRVATKKIFAPKEEARSTSQQTMTKELLSPLGPSVKNKVGPLWQMRFIQDRLIISVTRKKLPNVYKSCQK